MNPASYLYEHFSDYHVNTRYELLSDGSKRIAKRCCAIFDRFMQEQFLRQAITEQHISAFMMYRVVGEADSTDESSGSVQLKTFLAADHTGQRRVA
jgi:hypothetical protein